MDTNTVTKKDISRQVILPVTNPGSEMKIVVGGGTFRIGKDQYTLPEDFVYKYTTVDHALTVYFYLMKKKQDNSVVVLVDEIHPDELPLSMMNDNEYDYLWQIASLKVPAKAQDFSKAKLTILHSDTETAPSRTAKGRN